VPGHRSKSWRTPRERAYYQSRDNCSEPRRTGRSTQGTPPTPGSRAGLE
jgi:hypothetical protein